MAVLSKGTTFATGDQVTATTLNNLVDNSTFASGAVDNTTTQLSSGRIIVKDGGVSTAKIEDDAVTTLKILDSNVTKAKIEDVADMKVLGNTSGSATAPQEVDVIDESSGISSNDNDTSIPTSAAVKDLVDTSIASSINDFAIIESAATGARNGSTYYFNDLSETVDADNIVSVTSGEITFASTGTYLIDVSGSMIDSDGSSGDAYALTLTSGTSSTTGLLNQSVTYNQSQYKPISIKYIRTVSDTATDKLALYASPISGADITLWQANDVVIVITKLS